MLLMAALTVLGLFVAANPTSAWEASAFHTVYDWPIGLKPFMLACTMLGSTWMVAAVAVRLFALKKTRLSLYVLLVALTSYAISEVTKHIVGRARPFSALSFVLSRDATATGMGFPSGHTAVATAVALVLYRFMPKPWRYTVPVWIALVGLSRVYLGVHWPLDVVGGFLLGAIVTETFWQIRPLVRRWAKSIKST